MPHPDEVIRLRLERRGDDWSLVGAQRRIDGGVNQDDGDLEAAVTVSLDPDATTPSEVLETVGRVLELREYARRHVPADLEPTADNSPEARRARGLEPIRPAANVQRVLDEGLGRSPIRSPLRLADEQRAAAQDDPRGEADR